MSFFCKKTIVTLILLLHLWILFVFFRGLWNVPYINHAYLIQGSILQDPENYPSFINGLLDPDMAFCKNLRDKVRHLYFF